MKHIRLFFIWHIVYQRKRMTPLAFLKSVDDMIFWNPQRRQLISEIIIYSVFALKCTTKIKWGYSNYCGIHLGKQVEKKKYESIWAIWIIRFKGPNKETHLKKKMPSKCACFSGEFHHDKMATSVVHLTKFVPVTCQPLSKWK